MKDQRAAKKRSAEASNSLGACPSCQSAVVEQTKAYSCSNWRNECKFVIWKTIAGKKLTQSQAKTLLEKGKTSTIKGFRSKAGKPFEARLTLI